MAASQINFQVKLSKVKKRTVQIGWFVRSCCVDQCTCRIVIGQENKLALLIQSSDQFHYIKLIPGIKKQQKQNKKHKIKQKQARTKNDERDVI